jgi:hypothetical protein
MADRGVVCHVEVLVGGVDDLPGGIDDRQGQKGGGLTAKAKRENPMAYKRPLAVMFAKGWKRLSLETIMGVPMTTTMPLRAIMRP